jgi:hypothetical protein
MNKRNLLIAGGAAAFSLALIALPGTSAKTQSPQDRVIARLQQEIAELKAQQAAEGTLVQQDPEIFELQ